MTATRCVRCLVAVALGLAGTAGFAAAQSSAPMALPAALSGGHEREWIRHPTVTVLSHAGARCVEGENWVFAEDGTLAMRRCENGLWQDRQVDWYWLPGASGQTGDAAVMVDGRRYEVELRQRPSELAGEPPVLFAILRTRRTRQDEPVEEIRLEHRAR